MVRFRLPQGMDIYSNILYVKEDFAGLSNMAHHAIETDKYRPESVCIVGNYYSLKGQHEKVGGGPPKQQSPLVRSTALAVTKCYNWPCSPPLGTNIQFAPAASRAD